MNSSGPRLHKHIAYTTTEGPLLDEWLFQKNLSYLNSDLESLSQLFSEKSAGSPVTWRELTLADTPYAAFCSGLSREDRLLTILCLAAQLFPEKLWNCIESSRNGIALTNLQLGGYISTNTSRFIPSLKTAIYLDAGDDVARQLESRKFYLLFSTLFRNQILNLGPFLPGEPVTDDADLVPMMSEEFVQYLVYGREVRPDFGKDFPGELITTDKEWSDLVLIPTVQTQINNIGAWLTFENEIKQLLRNKFRKGFTSLFHGPPGTGKTLAAMLLGKKYQRKVFRVDLSMIVDKYIGETEKKLSALFDRMEMFPGSILLFDESDVIFGKRTTVGDSKDRWANLLTGFLLQRIESYDGVCILTSNRKTDIDNAMLRRFDSMVEFKTPPVSVRMQLWKKFLPENFSFDNSVDLAMIAKYELSGGQIENIMKWCVTSAVVKSDCAIQEKYVLYFMALELGKHGLTLPNNARLSATAQKSTPG